MLLLLVASVLSLFLQFFYNRRPGTIRVAYGRVFVGPAPSGIVRVSGVGGGRTPQDTAGQCRCLLYKLPSGVILISHKKDVGSGPAVGAAEASKWGLLLLFSQVAAMTQQ